ncbi:RNA recognition motif [Popillia japonica]|uniref:17S U2 SnRNP complex component HTATSF1 n=1 Tax=Popillia japonica TaxID=7064 RepID=A0AAW1J0D4_POPJA
MEKIEEDNQVTDYTNSNEKNSIPDENNQIERNTEILSEEIKLNNISQELNKPNIDTVQVANVTNLSIIKEDDRSDDIKDVNNSDAESKKDTAINEYDPKNVHYEGDIAVYTDPATGYQYQWDKAEEKWIPKVSAEYGFEDDTHTYTDADGVKFFWDKEKNAWFPKINDDFMAKYQMSYGFVDNTTAVPVEPVKDVKVEKKIEPKGVKRKPNEPTWFELDEQCNTKVYVSNLPTDTTEEEFVELMQKCGLVMRDPVTQNMKIKLYKEPGTDYLKGDALCTYIRVESVDLALKLLNDSIFKGKKINVERAKFQMRGQYDPKLKPKTKKRKEKEKLKRMQEKLFDWRPEKVRGERAKHEKVVIVKNVFDPKVFDDEVGLILEYQQDLREECSKCGEVRKVVIYDRHPEGIIQVNMKEPEEADAVVVLLNGRWFGKRKLTAEIWDGKTKYKIAETDSEISKRLTKWDSFLEADTTNKLSEKSN